MTSSVEQDRSVLRTPDLIKMGFSKWDIKGIRAAGRVFGDSPFRGRITTRELIMNWLDRHPDFVPSHFLRKTKP